MTIIERLRTEFSGITVMMAGVAGALRAVCVYNRAQKQVKAQKNKYALIIEGPTPAGSVIRDIIRAFSLRRREPATKAEDAGANPVGSMNKRKQKKW